jgi:hypothetical protein
VPHNLLDERWRDVDATELRILLQLRLGGQGQFTRGPNDRLTHFLPVAGDLCKLKLTWRGNTIVSAARGRAFDSDEWSRIRAEIDNLILGGPAVVGRDFSFCRLPVLGSWMGTNSGVQILPAAASAPRPRHDGEHPFVLEFPVRQSISEVTSHRRLKTHRNLTNLLNVLLRARTSLQPYRSEHFWAAVSDDAHTSIKWVQRFYIADLGNVIVPELSDPVGVSMRELEPDVYYDWRNRTENHGSHVSELRVPTNLDAAISKYQHLPLAKRADFDRSSFWLDLASRQWTLSISASFTSLVSSIESLINKRGSGAAARFRAFLETYAEGSDLRNRRGDMYDLRSGILHGSDLMLIDQEFFIGSSPPWWREQELTWEMWELTRLAMRNWLMSQT